MRILALSDVEVEALYSREVLEIAGDVDLVVSCGDLPYPYLEFILTMLRVPLLFVRGNHDGPITTAEGRVVENPEGAVDIDGRVTRIRVGDRSEWIVGGAGGSMFYGGARNQYTERQMHARIRRMEPRLRWNRLRHGRALDVFVTHAPMRDVHDGADRAHQGFESFVRLVKKHGPRLFIHGHIHPSYGIDMTPRTLDGTRVVSVYGYQVMELADE